ncbi:MAG: hypothetical protein ACK559_35825, partial [bacterium]
HMIAGEGVGNREVHGVLARRQGHDHRERRLEDGGLIPVPVGEGVPAEEEFRVQAVVVDRDRRQPLPRQGHRAVLDLQVEGRIALGSGARGARDGGDGLWHDQALVPGGHQRHDVGGGLGVHMGQRHVGAREVG